METKYYAIDSPSGFKDFNSKQVSNANFIRALNQRGICTTTIRQWLKEVTFISPSGKEATVIGFDLGNGSFALTTDYLFWHYPSQCGFVHIQRNQKKLCVLPTLSAFLAFQSQNIFNIPKCDYIIYNMVHTRAREGGKILRKICREYEEVHSYLPSSLSDMLPQMKPKKGELIDHTKIDLVGNYQFITSTWLNFKNLKPDLPMWKSCTQCFHFLSCNPERLAWDLCCKNYCGKAAEDRYITLPKYKNINT